LRQRNETLCLTKEFRNSLGTGRLGFYGVTANTVEQRTSEIGVRMALGSNRGQVVGMVLRGAFLQTVIVPPIGIPAAIGAVYLIASVLFGVSPWDRLMISLATILLGIAVVAAAVIPAQRVAVLNPAIALRSE
jgi:ABC-type antimicrobial peptide transport system permease subunit